MVITPVHQKHEKKSQKKSHYAGAPQSHPCTTTRANVHARPIYRPAQDGKKCRTCRSKKITHRDGIIVLRTPNDVFSFALQSKPPGGPRFTPTSMRAIYNMTLLHQNPIYAKRRIRMIPANNPIMCHEMRLGQSGTWSIIRVATYIFPRVL